MNMVRIHISILGIEDRIDVSRSGRPWSPRSKPVLVHVLSRLRHRRVLVHRALFPLVHIVIIVHLDVTARQVHSDYRVLVEDRVEHVGIHEEAIVIRVGNHVKVDEGRLCRRDGWLCRRDARSRRD